MVSQAILEEVIEKFDQRRIDQALTVEWCWLTGAENTLSKKRLTAVSGRRGGRLTGWWEVGIIVAYAIQRWNT